MTSEYVQSMGFDWARLVQMPTVSEEWHTGHQIMNFYPKDKDYRDSPAAAAIVAEHFGDAEALGAEEHEFKAFQEFLDSTGKRAVYLAYNQCFEQAVAQIV